MFGFGKKKELVVDDDIYTQLAGQVIAIEEVSDPVFSKKIMGDGFAVEPDGNKIYSPVTARVELV